MAELNGVLLINKSAGISSAGVVRRIKNLCKIRKIGHAGTLDPFATGLLICCINRATRLSHFFLNCDKKYKGVMKLGVDTDTQDSTGSVIRETRVDDIPVREIFKTVVKFKGSIYQTPPVFSALKHKGVPLYKLARKGVYIDKPPRHIFIHSLDISDVKLPEISFEIHCSSGTYVRTICSDIGKMLGCGGHLKSLHRVEVNNFSVDKAYKLEDLKDIVARNDFFKCVLPMNEALDFLPSYCADRSLVSKICNGVKLHPTNFIDSTRSDAIFNFDGEFFKVIDMQDNLVAILGSSDDSTHYNYCCVF